MRFWFTRKNPYWPGNDEVNVLRVIMTAQIWANEKLKRDIFVSVADVLNYIGIPIKDKYKILFKSYGWRVDMIPGYIDFGIKVNKKDLSSKVSKKAINLNTDLLFHFHDWQGFSPTSLEYQIRKLNEEG